jgi:hypothetical protein
MLQWLTPGLAKVGLEIGLKGEEFHSALVYAGGQDWLDVTRKRVGLSSPVQVRRLQELRPSHGANN